MKIAMVSLDASPVNAVICSRGGHVAALAGALSRHQHEVTVYTGNSDLTAEEHMSMNGFAVTHLPPTAAAFADMLVAQWQRERPDVVHAQSWASGLVSAMSARHAQVPLVQTVDEPDGKTVQSRSVERGLCHAASRIVVTSERRAAALIRAGARRAQVYVVPPGVDTELFQPDSSGRSRSLPHRVVWLGEPLSFNNIDVSSVVPNTKFATIGGTAQLLSDQDRAALLRSADVAVCAGSSAEQEALTLQAMSCGVPVIALIPDGPSDMVVHGITGLHVPQGSVAELLRTLRALVADSTKQDLLGTTARDRACVRYSWGRVASDLVQAYDQAIGSRRNDAALH
ncbi:glycosyltransferase [Lentzea xinjiangensis]|uniref:glycosyltransferase n=1 Tax=Lentzea xinjiangensis TaxID=402600 RepID=UPI001160277B|nr:glycosyltransferase [Lentzea xinjiangensis]